MLELPHKRISWGGTQIRFQIHLTAGGKKKLFFFCHIDGDVFLLVLNHFFFKMMYWEAQYTDMLFLSKYQQQRENKAAK